MLPPGTTRSHFLPLLQAQALDLAVTSGQLRLSAAFQLLALSRVWNTGIISSGALQTLAQSDVNVTEIPKVEMYCRNMVMRLAAVSVLSL